MIFRQAKWDEPTIFERSVRGTVGYYPQNPASRQVSRGVPVQLPNNLIRKKFPELPEVSEIDVLRHFTRLSQQNYSPDLGIHPLGSCTMKYNPKVCDLLASSHKMTDLHPSQDPSLTQGILQVMYELSVMLAEIVGTAKVSLQPSAGAHAEFTGVMIMRAHHKLKGELSGRNEIIVPDSAHGTNPASAAMGGFKVVEVPSNNDGQVDVEALKAVVGKRTAGIMITNPNTLGIFESDILEIAEIVHDAGGLLYYDGANLNAILGRARPGDMGFDIVHINIHKTFATPHGGGGPGAGPIGVTSDLEKFLPVPTIEFDGSRYRLHYDRPHSIGRVRAFYGNVAVLLRAYAYILLLGAEGLREVSDVAVLNANYVARKLSKLRGFSLPYVPSKPRKHECVVSVSKMAEETGVNATHVSKRLLDFGIHAPTVNFPLIVTEPLMIEPTETVSKTELDQMIAAFENISEEAYEKPSLVLSAPKATTVSRVDEVKASHPRTLCLSWRSALQLYSAVSGARHGTAG